MNENIILKVDGKGRLTLPLKMRQTFHIKPGDVFFVKPDEKGIHLAKAENPFNDLVDYARYERKTGKSIELRAFAKKHKIPVKK